MTKHNMSKATRTLVAYKRAEKMHNQAIGFACTAPLSPWHLDPKVIHRGARKATLRTALVELGFALGPVK